MVQQTVDTWSECGLHKGMNRSTGGSKGGRVRVGCAQEGMRRERSVIGSDLGVHPRSRVRVRLGVRVWGARVRGRGLRRMEART